VAVSRNVLIQQLPWCTHTHSIDLDQGCIELNLVKVQVVWLLCWILVSGDCFTANRRLCGIL